MKKAVFKFIYKYLILIIGLIIYAIAYNLFLLPNNLVIGGVTGLSIIVAKYTPMDPSLFISITSIGLIIIGFIFCDKQKIYSSVVASILLPIIIKLTSGFCDSITLDITPLMSIILCGLMIGFGVGMIFRVGLSTGGTEIIYFLLEKVYKNSIGKLMFMVEGIIIIAGFFAFGFQNFMYALIILFINSKLSDKVVTGFTNYKLICIIPYKYDEVLKYLKSLHNVKVINLTNEKNQNIIYTVIYDRDYLSVYNSINEIDSKAFMSISNTYEEIGGLSYE